jgi:hypothetical protein
VHGFFDIFEKNDIENGIKDFLSTKIEHATVTKTEDTPDSFSLFFDLT